MQTKPFCKGTVISSESSCSISCHNTIVSSCRKKYLAYTIVAVFPEWGRWIIRPFLKVQQVKISVIWGNPTVYDVSFVHWI